MIKKIFFITKYFSDVAMFMLSAYLSLAIVHGKNVVISLVPEIRFFLFSLLVLLITYAHYDLYKDKRNLFDENQLMSLFYSNMITFIIVIFLVLLFGIFSSIIDILIICAVFVFSFVLTSIARFMLAELRHVARIFGYDRKKVLFYGLCCGLSDKVRESPHLGYDIIARTNTISNLKKYLDKVDIVFITKPMDEKLMDTMIEYDWIEWKVISDASNLIMDQVTFDEFKDYPIINIAGKMHMTYFLKRVMDLIFASIALIILSPLFLIIAILIKLTMPGPVFFKHERLGKDLKQFKLYKFRSMVVGAEKIKNKLKSKNETKGLFKMKHDPRITPFGKILRRTYIDELPQLINIFKGEMSVVGPRPHLKKELPYFKGWRRARFKVKPGLTGLWQVNGRHELNFDKAVLYDIFYVKHMSFFLDLSIILKTIPSILMSRGKH